MYFKNTENILNKILNLIRGCNIQWVLWSHAHSKTKQLLDVVLPLFIFTTSSFTV